jgi:serine/threonine-protein kinase
LVDLKADTTWVLVEGVRRAWYTPTGHVVYVDDNGAVFAAPFDLDRLELSGTHELMFEGVYTFSAAMVMGQDGTVIFREIPGSALNRLVWMDRRGGGEPVDPDWPGRGFYSPALSPNGRRVAVHISDPDAAGSQIWVKELPNGPRMQLTNGEGWQVEPAWSPDGTTIIYSTVVGGNYALCSLPSDGRSEGSFEVLLDPDGSVRQPVYTPDGEGMVFSTGRDIGYLDLTTGEIREDFLATESWEKGPALSPDGRWMAYNSNRTGGWEVYVRPFPDVQSYVRQVSTDGGRYPLWSPNGRELFYRGADGSVMMATYSADPVFTVTDRQRLFDPGFGMDPDDSDWDYSPAGDRFVMRAPIAGGGRISRAILIRNFFTELEEKAGGHR